MSAKMAKHKKFKVDVAEAKKRVDKIFPKLKRAYPDAKTSLDHKTPLELLIATIMAAQCTDARVNIVTKDLFKKYRTVADFASADLEVLGQDIRSTGFFRNKSANIIKCCQVLVEKFDSKVPSSMDELLELNGVGRKTANVMLGNAFNTPGIVCDTHVIRLSRRLQLSGNSDPVKLELDLMEIVPRKRLGGWTQFSHVLVYHGRAICKARKPDCDNCPISADCPAAGKPEFQ
jgi:endonuclease-3